MLEHHGRRDLVALGLALEALDERERKVERGPRAAAAEGRVGAGA